MDYYLHYDSLNIPKEWFEIGKNKQVDNPDSPSEVAFRFVAYWIAFNGLYGQHDNRDISERQQIEECLKAYEEKISGIFNFDKDDELTIFIEKPVFNRDRVPKDRIDYRTVNPFKPHTSAHFCVEDYQQLIDCSNPEGVRLVALMKTVYQVRCNMFHGSKTPSPERNYKLVYASQYVLEKLLKAMLGIPDSSNTEN